MIPPTQYINPGPMPTQADPGAAMQAGKAVAAVGAAIANIGEAGMEIMGRVRRVKEAGEITAFMTNLDEEASRFSLELARRPDTENWVSDWQEKAADMKQRAGALGLSPEAKAKLDLEFNSWTSQRSIHFETQAATKALGIAKAQTAQSLEYYAARNDRDGFNRTLETGVQGGLFNPAEKQKAEMEFERQSTAAGITRMIEADPLEAERQLNDPEFLKKNPGATVHMVESAKSEVKSAVHRQSMAQADAAEDAVVSGKIKTLEDLDQKFPNMRPMVKDQLKTWMQKRVTEEFRQMAATPEYQQEVIGRVSAKLADYNPTAEGVDADYVEMRNLIEPLPDGPMKQELEKRLRDVREGKISEIKTHADAAMKSVDEVFKARPEIFGKVVDVGKVPLKKFVDDGFLRDASKLQRLGFAEDVARTIAAIKDPALAQQQFREQWKDRPGGSINASPDEIAVADAIRLENGNTMFDDPASAAAAGPARIERERALGAVKTKLAEWLKRNPDAKEADIDAKVMDIIGGQGRARKVSELMPKKAETSGGPNGASDATAAVPVGKNLTEIVKHFEAGGAAQGFHPEAYWDYGQWSIGYGTKAKEGEVIDKAEAEKRLSKELSSARADVEAEASRVGMALQPHELDALTSFQYNTGKIGTLLADGKRSKAEVADMMLQYHKADGKTLRGLENRRKAERTLFLNGYTA